MLILFISNFYLINFAINYLMKLEKILEDTIKIKLNPRRPLFYTRVKFFLWGNGQWVESCRGLLIFYKLNSSYYFTIMNIMKFQIDFDMEIYTNFLKYAKFFGDTKTMQFLIPSKSHVLAAAFVLQSKQELTELKRKLQSEFYGQNNDVEQLQFFKQPEVQQLLKQADISEQTIQTKMKLRSQIERQIKDYFDQLDQLQKKKKNSGFKAYGLGRDQWKYQQQQKQFLKQQKKKDLVEHLARLNKQSKML